MKYVPKEKNVEIKYVPKKVQKTDEQKEEVKTEEN